LALDEHSEKELVDLANEGDALALEALYRRHRDWVVSLAWRILGNKDDALDVMQGVFAEFIDKFPGFKLVSTIRAFLYPVVKHHSISLIRKQRKVVPLKESHTHSQIDRHSEPNSDFGRIINDLPKEHKEIVVLRFGLGMTMDEMAHLLEVPLGTVKSRLHNALKRLRQKQSTQK